MRKCYWHIIVAAFASITIAASPSPNRSDREENDSQKQIARSLERIGVALDDANKSKGETADCGPTAEDRQSDLCAQWKAANASAQAAKAADDTVRIGWIGLALGFVTMGAAIAAAIFAWRAAKHANESVEGFRAVEKPNLRLYISEIEPASGAKRITLAISNIGRTDAIVSFFAWGFAAGDASIPYLVGPNRTERVNGSGDIELGFVTSKMPFQAPETLVALIKYETVFGGIEVERRRWLIEGKHAVERQIDE